VSYFYVLTSDGKSPILFGPYREETDALRKQSEVKDFSEVFDLPTGDRTRAVRMIKANGKGTELIERFKHG